MGSDPTFLTGDGSVSKVRPGVSPGLSRRRTIRLHPHFDDVRWLGGNYGQRASRHPGQNPDERRWIARARLR